ncbi:MAG: RNA polymerase factor sigma-32 [Hyphomicrobiales bacterium]
MKKEVKHKKLTGKAKTRAAPKPAPKLQKNAKRTVKAGSTKKSAQRMKAAKPGKSAARTKRSPKAAPAKKKPPAKPAARVKSRKAAPKKPSPQPSKTARAGQKAKRTPARQAPAEKKKEKPHLKAAKPAPEKTAKPLKAEQTEKAEESDKALVKFDPLQRYLSEISKYRLLTREEERDYGIRVKEQSDKDAAYVLVTANLRLVVKIALEFQRVWMQNLLDLIQEGNIGLMQAVKKFDPYKNVKFSYYASFWIKAYILKFIMDNWRLVKIGTTQGQRKLFFKLKKEKQRLIEQGFDPKPKLLSERLGVSEREIVDMDQRLDSWDVSLDAPLKNDSETERIEFLSTENESVEEQVSKKEIELLLHNKITEFRKKMSPREIEIFELRIFSDNPVTLQEIGDRYGISRERVRQIEKNIIRKMREFFKREIPDFASYSEDTGPE